MGRGREFEKKFVMLRVPTVIHFERGRGVAWPRGGGGGPHGPRAYNIAAQRSPCLNPTL